MLNKSLLAVAASFMTVIAFSGTLAIMSVGTPGFVSSAPGPAIV